MFPFRIFFYLNLFSLLRIFFNPSVLADTSPIFCYAKHPVMLRGTAETEFWDTLLLCDFCWWDKMYLTFSPYISLRKRPAVLRDTAREAGNFLLCEFGRAALFFCLIEKPDIKDYRLYRSISSMMSRRLYSRGILCCPPSLLWSRNQASNIPVLAGMISRHSSAILLNRLAS